MNENISHDRKNRFTHRLVRNSNGSYHVLFLRRSDTLKYFRASGIGDAAHHNNYQLYRLGAVCFIENKKGLARNCFQRTGNFTGHYYRYHRNNLQMNRTLKIGLIGFTATIGLIILIRMLFGVTTIYFAPLALPWGVVVIFGAFTQQNTRQNKD